jgi:predicted O-methyltransferase YrrM
MKHANFLEPTQIDGLGPRYQNHPGPYAIDDVDLNRVFPGILEVQAEPYLEAHVRGDANPPNLRFLTRVVAYTEPKKVLEVGTFRGKTAYNFALNTPTDSEIITIALPKDMISTQIPGYGTDYAYFQSRNEIGDVFKGKPEGKKIRQIIADSRSIVCQQQLDTLLKGVPIDFAFIDASHDHDAVKANFEELVLPRMRTNGIVVFDNYSDLQTHPGVAHYLTSKAYEDGYVFYWYAPLNEKTSCVLFINDPESRNRQWR